MGSDRDAPCPRATGRWASRISWACLLAVLLGCVLSSSASAAPFRIRKAEVRGDDLFLYHEPPPGARASDAVQVRLGEGRCVGEPESALRPNRGGDEVTVLIVVDRGGTPTAGMGPYSRPLLQGVRNAIAQASVRSPGSSFAIIDTNGRAEPPRQLPPTSNQQTIVDFLNAAGPSKGAGADIYGVSNQGLQLLDAAPSVLRAVIVVSDGIDPTAAGESGADDRHGSLIREAHRRGVPVAVVHWDRSEEPRVRQDKRAAAALQLGRARLLAVANQTDGELKTVNGVADKDGSKLAAALVSIGDAYLSLQRTSCKVCGTAGGADLSVTMRVLRDEKIHALSREAPPVKVRIPPGQYPTCAVAAGASAGGDASPSKNDGAGDGKGGDEAPVSCATQADCASHETCASGTCLPARCERNEDCGDEGRCEGGECQPTTEEEGNKTRLWIGLGVGGLALLGLITLLAGRRQRPGPGGAGPGGDPQARTEPLPASARPQPASTASADSTKAGGSTQPAADRAPGAARRETELGQARKAGVPGVRVILSSLDDSPVRIRAEVGAGSHVLGADEACDVRVPFEKVSGKHLRLEVGSDGRVTATDLGSTNGTWLDSHRLPVGPPVELRSDDVIGISRHVWLKVEIHAVTDAPGARRGQTLMEG